MKNLTKQALVALSSAALLASCGASNSSSSSSTDVSSNGSVEQHTDASSYEYDESSVVKLSLGPDITATSDAVSIDDATATITEAGTYEVSGTLEDGQLIVDAGGAVVQLVLNGANITNNDASALVVLNAEEAVVILAEDSINTLTDGSTYVLDEGEDEPNATLFSKADLTVGGTGSLTVVGNYNDGVASKDGLVIDGGNIDIVAIDDGIRGKDYVVIKGGEIDITSGGDGIKSDEEEDPERGFISIFDGTIAVTADDDGLQTTTDLVVTGGSLSVDAADDAINSTSTVTIDDGQLTLAAGDDGIHGDLFVTINGGSIVITESFEGIESEVVTINNGDIDVTSSDDGINVASAEAAPVVEEPAGDNVTRPPRGGGGAGGGAGGGGDANVGEYYIYINGGTVAITITGDLAEQGDGIDANGHVEMTGGLVMVSGPTDTRNSAIDYSGGSFTMTGGTFIGTNIDGRNSEGIGASSTQASLYLTLDSVFEAGTPIYIQSSGGGDGVSFEPANRFDVVVFGSPDLVAGESYDLYVGEDLAGTAIAA